MQIVAAHKAEACDQTQLLRSRQRGGFRCQLPDLGGWVAITKDMLTEVLGAGRDVKIVGLPRAAVESLRLTCRDLAVG